ncbi:hypothetical protein I4U23_002261 [Adineta vaga]|nr:hypothetical protein I4U23_002261 [Adineta vaga]
MISSDINSYQSQITTDNTHAISNLISSTSFNPITTHAESIAIQALPAPLAAPCGWRSEIIHSNSPALTDQEREQLETNTNFNSSNYQEYNTSQTNQYSSGCVENSNQYARGSAIQNRSFGGHVTFADNESVAENALVLRNRSMEDNALVTTNRFHDDQTILTHQQQQDIIHRVEHQQPPPLVIRKPLQNNTVTYQQNISVRYLQPPTPPPPGPIIIRKYNNFFNLFLFITYFFSYR